MGTYLNPGNDTFRQMVETDTYVDKTGLIAYMNDRIGKAKHLIASSRPRRFGKTLAADMLSAYYSKGCDSRDIFCNLEIARDASYEQHLNQYDVICMDIQWMYGIARKRVEEGKTTSVLNFIQSEVVKELYAAYPNYVAEDETLIASALTSIYNQSKNQFVIIIDEWDCMFREDKDNVVLQEEYIDFLRSLFKGGPADKFVKLAYITGILPIKKYGTQSALNNFRELTMTAPGGIARYIGFVEKEVTDLCQKCGMPFEKMKKWYDGYIFDNSIETDDEGGAVVHVYSPNSVMEAVDNGRLENYWSQTETYESLKLYISMNFDGLKQKVVDMLGGKRCKIDVESFQNDMTSFHSSDDVLTLLIHLGYLAYDSKNGETFIPNEEVKSTFVRAVKYGIYSQKTY